MKTTVTNNTRRIIVDIDFEAYKELMSLSKAKSVSSTLKDIIDIAYSIKTIKDNGGKAFIEQNGEITELMM